MPQSIHALLDAVVDYAGTFPPAGLSLADALAEYARARQGADAWLLGRLVIPFSSLHDFERIARRPLENDDGPWDLSVVLTGEATLTLEVLQTFNEQWRGTARIASVEFPPIQTPHIAARARQVPEGVEMFFETPLGPDLGPQLAAIKAVGAAAKVRTGGITADVIPTLEALGGFLGSAHQADVVFKATAGLHHATRGCYPLTYQAGSDRATLHGFLNLAVAAAVLHSGGTPLDVLKALAEPSLDRFEFRPDGLRWEGWTIPTDGLADTRRRFFRSFGSCSLREPAAELRHRQAS